MKKFLNVLCVFIVGIITGLFGSGGGLVLVPYLSLYLKYDERESRATTLFIIFIFVLASMFFYLKNENYDFFLLIKLILGGLVGSYLGSKWLVKINQDLLNGMFILFLLYSGIKFIF